MRTDGATIMCIGITRSLSTPWWLFLFFLVGCQVMQAASGQTTQVTQPGSSGKFRISNDKGAADPNRVTVEVDSVYEIPAASTNHNTPTVANQDFSISDGGLTTIDGVSAYKVTFASDLTTNGGSSTTYGTIQLDTYIIQETGTITTDTESFDVVQNDVKFNIILSNWDFASTSTHVDVALIIKGRDGSEDVDEKRPNVWDLGGSVPLILSGRVVVDGIERDMPDGYPRYIQNGNKYTFEFRFPKFSSSATYDPIVGYSSAGACCFPSFAWAVNVFRSFTSYFGY